MQVILPTPPKIGFAQTSLQRGLKRKKQSEESI